MARPTDERAISTATRRWQVAGIIVFLLLIVAFPLYRAVDSTRRDEALASRDAALVALGGRIWSTNCAECHGTSGQGVDAPALNSQEFLTTVSDTQTHYITAAGIPGTEMPAWWNELGGSLTDEQITAVVAFTRSWEDSAPSRPDWRDPGGTGGHM